MSFRDHFVDLSGEPLLLPGVTIDHNDRLYEPHEVGFDELVGVAGTTDHRRLLLGHLRGLMLWLDRAAGLRHRVWLRGELAAALHREPGALDVLAIVDHPGFEPGDEWVAEALSTRPRLAPIELVFDTVDSGEPGAVLRERRRSAVRCTDADGEQVVTGWAEVTL